MIISLINKKGGVGKTPFAFSLAKDLNFFLQSNDNSIIESIYPKKAKISKEPILLDDCVYDFGGFVDKGVVNILKESDFIIIPCIQSYNSILRSIETINEIKDINKNIIVLISGYKSDTSRDNIKEMIIKNSYKLDFYFFKYSKIIDNSMIHGLSFTELYNETALSKLAYKNFFTEYENLLNRLNKERIENEKKYS